MWNNNNKKNFTTNFVFTNYFNKKNLTFIKKIILKQKVSGSIGKLSDPVKKWMDPNRSKKTMIRPGSLTSLFSHLMVPVLPLSGLVKPRLCWAIISPKLHSVSPSVANSFNLFRIFLCCCWGSGSSNWEWCGYGP